MGAPYRPRPAPSGVFIGSPLRVQTASDTERPITLNEPPTKQFVVPAAAGAHAVAGGRALVDALADGDVALVEAQGKGGTVDDGLVLDGQRGAGRQRAGQQAGCKSSREVHRLTFRVGVVGGVVAAAGICVPPGTVPTVVQAGQSEPDGRRRQGLKSRSGPTNAGGRAVWSCGFVARARSARPDTDRRSSSPAVLGPSRVGADPAAACAWAAASTDCLSCPLADGESR